MSNRSARFDLARLGAGAVATAALSVGLAAGLLQHAYRTEDVGPTSATLEEAGSVFYGAGLGLVLGSAFTTVLVRKGSPVRAGIIAGLSAYLLVLAPIIFLAGPSDVTVGENLELALVLILPAAAFSGLGAVIGLLLIRILRR